ncbi:ubiquinol-cytochrome c reductase cytochrome b subunit [Actinomadura sp. BRA 177]|uniref:cytochrome bc1 complex cytochrome b subunit n=1 Tax=Actinomadura sp. BRA 177 TaxID=2745202 RepID=UPI001595982F|nr:ubiquinol-cytochrome c reductase cytochrome b subunit [Actinomadura sp. BRA 177]NVI90676.1 ubiquinol-cytochrome c reductase cytochrome b subunit [Actinomadura sp. BRA 177]
MAGRKGGVKAAEKAETRVEKVFWGTTDRLGTTSFLDENIKKAFPKHWSFLLGEIALYSFIILVITGVFLTLFFKPSGAVHVYDGSYAPLKGVKMSDAYSSTLDLTFDVRGGLLMRQIHHWAANIFLAAIVIHLMRIFFTGAFRKPRELNWVIGVTMFALAVAEGFAGYSLPDDLLSGTGLRIFEGILLSIPVIGTYATLWVFGGEFPSSEDFIPRLFTVHILLIPGILIALITVHLMILWHQTHTTWPGKGRREMSVSGEKTFPHFATQSGAYFLFTFGILAGLGAFFQINPVWLYGPYGPDQISSGSQPDWYVGFLEGSLRIMGRLSTDVGGHTIAWNVLLPAVILPAVFFTLIGLYPFAERWATGDERIHHLLDRPRNAPTRTGIGAAAVVWYINLLAAGGNDVIADKFQIPLFWTTWFFRVGFFVGPIAAFIIARRVCLYLQRRELQIREEGVESGLISLTPDGAFEERHEQPSEEREAVVRTRQPGELVAPYPNHLIPLPTPDRARTQMRTRANRFYLDYQSESYGGGQGDLSRGSAEDGEGG